jgi:hypothetical protein
MRDMFCTIIPHVETLTVTSRDALTCLNITNMFTGLSFNMRSSFRAWTEGCLIQLTSYKACFPLSAGDVDKDILFVQ